MLGKEYDTYSYNRINESITSDISDNKICDTCIKSDVCMYKSELEKAVYDIDTISCRTNVFIKTSITCKHWTGENKIVLKGEL